MNEAGTVGRSARATAREMGGVAPLLCGAVGGLPQRNEQRRYGGFAQ